MNNEYKIPQILFINGVFLKDCVQIDDIFEQRLLDNLSESETQDVVYDRLPSYFSRLSTWVKKTNIKCWYCDLNFDTAPVFIPLILEHIGGDEYNISVKGCFCGFACAQKHIDIHHQDICNNTKFSDMLRHLHFIFTGERIDEIEPASDKHDMVQYGGTKTKEDYRKEHAKKNEKV